MSDYENIQKKQNIVVGIFVLIAAFALIVLIYKFGDLPVAVSKLRSFKVVVQFPTAPGVQENTPVRFCGYRVGKVTNVMSPEKLKDLNTGLVYHQSKVILRIDKKYINIPSNVNVKLMTRGLGSSYIELAVDPTKSLEPIDPNLPETCFLYDSILLQGSTGMTSEFFPEESQKKLDDLTNKITVLITNLNDILGDKQNKTNIKSTLANMSAATKQITDTAVEFEKFSAVAASASEELSETLVQLQMVLEKVNNGQGTISRLVNDGRLYENLLENTEQLNLLLEDIRKLVNKMNEKGVKVKL